MRLKRLDSPDALEASVEALLYQGGYLTIDRRVDGETAVLRIPNNEVCDSLYDGYIARLFGRVNCDPAVRAIDAVKTECASNC